MYFSANNGLYTKPNKNTTATKEAMGLAAMNPVCGISANHGSLMVNVMNHDKDLETGWQDYKAVTRSLDPKDNLYGIDDNGRIIAKHKFDVMDHEDIVEVFNIKSPNVDTIMESIEREASLPYDIRPVHNQSYLYEAFTGKKLLSEDQYTYDTLLERVELDKWGKILSGEADNMNPPKEEKDSNYIPDNDFPQGTENIQSPGMLLASANMGNAQDSFNSKESPIECERFSFNEGFFGDLKNKIVGNKKPTKTYKINDPSKVSERKNVVNKCINIARQEFSMIKDPALKRSMNLFDIGDKEFKDSFEDFIHGDNELFIGEWESSSYTKDIENDDIIDEFEDKRDAVYKKINSRLKMFKMTIEDDCCEYDHGSIVLIAEKGFQESALIIDDGRFHF